MNEPKEAALDSSPAKKSVLRMFGKFLLYGGWLLVLIVGLLLMILFSAK